MLQASVAVLLMALAMKIRLKKLLVIFRLREVGFLKEANFKNILYIRMKSQMFD